MSAPTDLSNLSVRQYAERSRHQMVPLTSTFSYFSPTVPLTEEDIREYLEEPIASLPPGVVGSLPKVYLLLVPYLQRPAGKEKLNGNSQPTVTQERPADGAIPSAMVTLSPDEAALIFAIEDQEVADYHYRFYHLLATLLADRLSDEKLSQYYSLIRDELNASAHGEVDEDGWRLKQVLLRRGATVRRETKPFLAYARQSFIDTLTLYLHGICCDIDVETGPRQIPSRYLRKRLQLLQSLYPPPKGFAVFPEDLPPSGANAN